LWEVEAVSKAVNGQPRFTSNGKQREKLRQAKFSLQGAQRISQGVDEL
jgi:hypothetical protein